MLNEGNIKVMTTPGQQKINARRKICPPDV